MAFKKVLIANRGAIACRIIRTLKRMGISSVAVFSEADATSLHVAQADEAICIGPGPAAESYLRVEAVLAAARETGADAIHPGYGFLSENAAFAEACDAAGIVFIGPTPKNMRAFGLKHTARALAQGEGVPLAPGTDLLRDAGAAISAAKHIGYPVILKATAGGGGIGMRVCERAADIEVAFEAVTRLAHGNFADGGVFLERFVRRARHIEVQVFGDGAGRVIALGERDCSLQRRNQKVIEEAPAPHLSEATRGALIGAALKLMQAARYRSAGTVEFLYDADRDDFFFLEVNTRLQVEHGVTEEIWGVDLVEWMIRGGAGDYGFLDAPPRAPTGASIQARLYAEDPAQDFRPSAGLLTQALFPPDARVETWVETGTNVSSFYDPMLAKLIVRAPDRAGAVTALQSALDATHIAGLETNVGWLRDVARSEALVSGQVSTQSLREIGAMARGVRVLSGGPSTTVQDWPGRLGFWHVGVPPSGPMDSRAFRLGNRLLGNEEGAPGLEITGTGPTLLFLEDVDACLAGAAMGATLDGAPLAPYTTFRASAGQTLRIGRVQGAGLRAYLMFAGGVEAPSYLGSASCFTLGGFGGHAGRALAAGDVLHVGARRSAAPGAIDAGALPTLTRDWRIRVLVGPHGAPDFFTPDDMAMLLGAEWRVHYNSNRTGVRLDGPKPNWARRDGGEAGLHPSNIHDNAYAVGAIDFTGDMPIILGPDGPSLGGFVCPFVIILADLWMIGQLAPGDTLRFVQTDDEAADAALKELDASIAGLKGVAEGAPTAISASPILHVIEAHGAAPRVVYRRQGDDNVLVEYGPLELDLELRVRVHALMLEMEKAGLEGVIDITPGVRSLQIHFDSLRLKRGDLLAALEAAEARLGDLNEFETASRIIHLPLSWDDPAIHETVERYMRSVRDDAPWTPNNIEFIRRVNGLSSIEDVQRIVFEASYLVIGLGDVYLGAPVAVPIDPRHRLVTTKYNPARTWTPPNVVGIGGAYMCIYGMEGPGGYQLFGRTIQVWNSHRVGGAFEAGKPWLLRFFDQIRFFPVSHDELTAWRRDFPTGRRPLRIKETKFRMSEYRAFLREHAEGIAAFKQTREAAFAAERAAWEERGEFERVAALSVDASAGDAAPVVVDDGLEVVEAPLGGSVWKIETQIGARVAAGDRVAIVEAMKAECDVTTPISGVVRKIYVQERQAVAAGAPLLGIEPE